MKQEPNFAMATLPSDALRTPQHEVQRLLGRCLLRLQQYERLIKAIMAHYEISGPVDALDAIKSERMADTARKTLGTLVGDLFGSFITNKTDTFGDETDCLPEDVTSVGMRMSVQLSDTDFACTKNNLKELVLLRNNLVHHFIDQHNLQDLEGCRRAQDALIAAYNCIDQHLEQLREWANDMEKSRRMLAEFLHSGVVHELVVNGIAPDGTVAWPAAGIVSALREAAVELAVDDGWASVADASKWVAERHSEQLPAKYGCRTWRQVVHESRVFELRYFEMNGQRSAWYREKENSADSH